MNEIFRIKLIPIEWEETIEQGEKILKGRVGDIYYKFKIDKGEAFFSENFSDWFEVKDFEEAIRLVRSRIIEAIEQYSKILDEGRY